MRSEWKKGNQSLHVNAKPSIDADVLYEQLLSSENEYNQQTSFEHPVPLPELIAVLTEVWEAEGVMF